MNRHETLTPAALQQKTVQTALGLKAACIKQGKGPGTPEHAVAERLLAAAKALPAYELAVQAVQDVGETGLPAAVIRKLGEK